MRLLASDPLFPVLDLLVTANHELANPSVHWSLRDQDPLIVAADRAFILDEWEALDRALTYGDEP